jgi:hypothetical protein
MDREEALREFLKSLKAALNNSSIYFSKHPIFIKASQELKKKTDLLLNFINPVKIDFGSNSLVVEGQNLEKPEADSDLAGFFHFRKIKSIELREGLTSDELVYFLAKVAVPPRQIFKEGGLENFLSNDPASHIFIEGLDYSQLLAAEGEGYKDIWIFLFRQVAEDKDAPKIEQLADNFGKIIAKFKSDDLLKNRELQENLGILFDYLRNTDKDRFLKCIKETFKLLLRSENIPQGAELSSLKNFLKELSSGELADTLWEELNENENFNSLNLNLFSVLFDDERHKEIASSLEAKSGRMDAASLRPSAKKRMRELFLSPDLRATPKIYQRIFLALLKEKAAGGGVQIALDNKLLHASYRLLLLNLLMEENSEKKMSLIRENILEEWACLAREYDTEFLKKLLEILIKRKDDPRFVNIFAPIKIRLTNFVENSVFQGRVIDNFEYFMDSLSESSFRADDYIKKIFEENVINQYIVKLFLTFFPEEGMTILRAELKKRSLDMEFLKNMIESLRLLKTGLGIEILKAIFSLPTLLIKIEVLKAMRQMPARDENFLFSILKEKNIFLKKEAFAILAGDEKTASRAVGELLDISNPLGLRNYLLENNIEVIIEKGALKQARDYLIALSKKRFFWNRSLRKKAKEAMGELDVRKD